MRKSNLALTLSAAMALGSLSGMTAFGETLTAIEQPAEDSGENWLIGKDQEAGGTETEMETEIGYAPEIENDEMSAELKAHLANVMQAYEAFIADVPNMDWSYYFTPTDKWWYSIVQMADEDHPQLLIGNESEKGYIYVHFADYNDETGEVVLFDGERSIENNEGDDTDLAISQKTDEPGVTFTAYSGIANTEIIWDMKVENGSLKEENIYNGDASGMPALDNVSQITWYDSQDQSGTAQIADAKWDGITVNMIIENGGNTAAADDTAVQSEEKFASCGAYEEYAKIIANAASQDFGDQFDPISRYQYALVKMADTDHEQLLLSSDQSNGTTWVKVYDYQDEQASVQCVTGTEHYLIGVAGVGGFRGALSQMTDRNSLRYWVCNAGDGATTDTQIYLANGSLMEDLEWQGTLGDASEPNGAAEEIKWYECSDLSGVNAKTAGADAQETGDDTASGDTVEAWIAQEKQSGRQVVSGTVRYVTYDECLQIQNAIDPNPQSQYRPDMALLILDDPTEMTGITVDSEFQPRTVHLIRIPDDIGQSHDGIRLYASFTKETLCWPSDTSLPLDEPATNDVRLSAIG